MQEGNCISFAVLFGGWVVASLVAGPWVVLFIAVHSGPGNEVDEPEILVPEPANANPLPAKPKAHLTLT